MTHSSPSSSSSSVSTARWLELKKACRDRLSAGHAREPRTASSTVPASYSTAEHTGGPAA